MSTDKKKCACCGEPSLEKDSMFEICDICGWQDDSLQNDDSNYQGGANKMSLNEAKSAFKNSDKVI